MKHELDAVVFDFDGVIVNTEPLHYEAFRKVLLPLNLAFTWEEYTAQYLGFDDRDAFREVFQRAGKNISDDLLQGLITDKAKVFRRFIREKGVEPYPGVVPLVWALSGRVPLALCSGALLGDIEPVLARLDLDGIFDITVTADDVEISKPNPLSYMLVLERLGLSFPNRPARPGFCVAIEDTPAGIEAASSAGLAVLAVCNTYPEDKLTGAARMVRSLEGLAADDLAALTPAQAPQGQGG